MNKKIIVKLSITFILLLLAILAYNKVNEWSLWQDSPNDYVDIEDPNREITSKEKFAYIAACIPFVALLVVSVLLLNNIRKDLKQKD